LLPGIFGDGTSPKIVESVTFALAARRWLAALDDFRNWLIREAA
jgi:hypothetical protein